MGYTIELSVLRELSLRREAAASAVLPGEEPAGDPPSLVEPDSAVHREPAHGPAGPPPSLPTTAA